MSCTDLTGTLDSDGDVTAEAGQGNHRPFTQLLGLSQAVLMPESVKFDTNIHAPQGSRGIGRFTTAVQVARRLGIHVSEVGFRGLCQYNLTGAYPY
jgi:hypothetical protein